jgi:hypothetical protein
VVYAAAMLLVLLTTNHANITHSCMKPKHVVEEEEENK